MAATGAFSLNTSMSMLPGDKGGQRLSKRGNSEGSLYQSSDGWRGYVWCTRPDGTRSRKYVRGKTYDEARQNWVNLRDQASRGPVSSGIPKLGEFLAYWLKEIVEPNLAPKRRT
jgi:hypothetical protein